MEKTTTELTKKYSCSNGHVHTKPELVRELGDWYDQLCCPICNDVMFDELHGHQYCQEFNNVIPINEQSDK